MLNIGQENPFTFMNPVQAVHIYHVTDVLPAGISSFVEYKMDMHCEVIQLVIIFFQLISPPAAKRAI